MSAVRGNTCWMCLGIQSSPSLNDCNRIASPVCDREVRTHGTSLDAWNPHVESHRYMRDINDKASSVQFDCESRDVRRPKTHRKVGTRHSCPANVDLLCAIVSAPVIHLAGNTSSTGNVYLCLATSRWRHLQHLQPTALCSPALL